MTLSRGIGAAMLAEMAKPIWYPVLLVYIDWPSGPVRMNTGRGTISWDSQSWTGVGDIAAFDLPGDNSGFASQQGAIRMAGTLADILATATENAKGKAVRAYLGALTARESSTLVGDPYLRWSGYVDGTAIPPETVEVNGMTMHGLAVSLASGPNVRNSAAIVHSYADQIAAFPGDTAGRHTKLAEPNAQRLKWPEAT